MLDATNHSNNGKGLLSAMETLLSNVYIPALRQLDNGWERTISKHSNQNTKSNFLNTMDSFLKVLVG